MKHKKKFLIIGNMNAVTCKQLFPFIKNNLLWYGVSIHSDTTKFYIPKDYPITTKNWGKDETGKIYVEVGGIRWFTNLDHNFRFSSKLVLHEHYTPEKYPKYDNYLAWNVNKVSEIPYDDCIDIEIDKSELELYRVIYPKLEVLSDD